MKTPKRLLPLIEDELVDEVIRPLMSGKEADVYIVRCGENMRKKALVSRHNQADKIDVLARK